MPPAHILNAPTKLMKHLGYGAGYEYDHEAEDAFSGQNYFPDGMDRERFYQPARPRLRTRDRPAAGILGGTEGEAWDVKSTVRPRPEWCAKPAEPVAALEFPRHHSRWPGSSADSPCPLADVQRQLIGPGK